MTPAEARAIIARAEQYDRNADVSKMRATWLMLKSTLWVATFPLVVSTLIPRQNEQFEKFWDLNQRYPYENSARLTRDPALKAAMIQKLPNCSEYFKELKNKGSLSYRKCSG